MVTSICGDGLRGWNLSTTSTIAHDELDKDILRQQVFENNDKL